MKTNEALAAVYSQTKTGAWTKRASFATQDIAQLEEIAARLSQATGREHRVQVFTDTNTIRRTRKGQ